MEAVLLVIHLIVAIGIVVTILIQPSEAGGFMGNSGSMSNLMMQRRSGDVLTRTTTILAGIFFLTSLLLAIAAGTHPAAKGVLDYDTDAKKKAAATIMDNVPDAPVQGVKKDAAAPSNSGDEVPVKVDSAPANEQPKKPKKK